MASDRRARSSFAFALALAMFVGGGLARAEPTPPEKERARDLMAEGRDLRDAGNPAGALKAFQSADAIMHVPTTGYEVAKTQQTLGLLVEARESALAVSKLPPAPGEPAPFVEARAKAEALLRELATLVPTIKVSVTVSGKPGEPPVTPTVTLDNQAVAVTDGPLRVNPGRHLLVARALGATETMATVTLAAGETKEVALRLEVSADAPAPAPPPAATPLAIPLVSWVAFGAAAAGLAVGSIAGIVALSQEGDIASRCNGSACPRAVEDDLDGARTVATVSTVGFVVAGVAAAVGVVGLIANRPSPSPASGSGSSALRVRLGGAGLVGRF